MSRRIIMQEVDTRLYLAPDGSWTHDCQEAKTFDHTYLALLEGLGYSAKKLQVVWCFRNPSLNMYLPVRSETEAVVCQCVGCPLAQAA